MASAVKPKAAERPKPDVVTHLIKLDDDKTKYAEQAKKDQQPAAAKNA